MKAPSLTDLRKVDKMLSATADDLYRHMLRSVVYQWSELSGNKTLENAVYSWDIPEMLRISDSLVAQVHATAALHFAANQIAALTRKYPWTRKESGLDPENAAIETFKLSERRCRRLNQWFRARRLRSMKNVPLTGTLSRMSSWIRYVIRDAPDLRKIYELCDITGGACVGVHGDATNLVRKLQAPYWSVTAPALPYFAASLCHNFHFATRVACGNHGVQSLQVTERDLQASVKVVNHNLVGFVPKTAKTFRSIAVEPLGNSYLQKGTDQVLRIYLRRVGLDLSRQDPNQRMAFEGSFDDEEGFCTIDLSSASDSISLGLCREILPPEWFNFLNCIRSPSYILPKSPRATVGRTTSDCSPIRYEKFVTMGNGFCFPLQTLIFASVVKSIQPNAIPGVDFRVYGDDIIVRKNIFEQVVAVLRKIGFLTNDRKTFGSGPFRESCGSNWYRGEDVTPMTLDFRLDSLESMFKFLNLTRRNPRTSAFFSEVLPIIFNRIPSRFRFVRPFKGRPETGIDPVGLEFTPMWHWHKAWQCHSWLELDTRAVCDRVGTRSSESWVVMAAALRGHSSSRPFTLRRQVERRIRRVASCVPEQQEYDLYLEALLRSNGESCQRYVGMRSPFVTSRGSSI